VLAVVGLVMRKRMGSRLSPAFGGAGGSSASGGFGFGGAHSAGQRAGTGVLGRLGAPQQAPAAASMQGFDAAAFERVAKAQFIALQQANDARDLPRLAGFFTPEMFEAVREEVAARGDTPQRTEVFGLQAQVVEAVAEAERHVVSVRFTGSVREQPGAVPEDLDEIWHLTQPRHGDGAWRVAGIEQVAKDR
jgi:predicted lipid-binding transport protein (Tim44 family)